MIRLLPLALPFYLMAGLITATPMAAQTTYHWDDHGNTISKLWSDAGNWDPDGMPESKDKVDIGGQLEAYGDITLFDDNSIDMQSLEIAGGASVVNSTDSGLTDDYRIDVAGGTLIHGSGSRMVLYGGDANFPVFGSYAFDTGWLDVIGGATLVLDSTTPQGAAAVRVKEGTFSIGLGGELSGTGRIDLSAPIASPSILLENKGAITVSTSPLSLGQAPAEGTLQITAASSNASFDWDGGGSGVINVNGNQTLDVNVSTNSHSFDGTINLATGATLDMAANWSVGSGSLNISTPAFGAVLIGQDPSPGDAAIIAGNAWLLDTGSINIANSWDSLRIDSMMVANAGSSINNRGTITFNAPASIQSGSDFNMTGSGASLVVNSNVTIDTPDFNLDGSGAVDNTTTINSNGLLELNLGSGADDSFDHTINLNGGGQLDVETLDNDWNLGANAVISADGGGVSKILGETLQVSGNVAVSGSSTLVIAAPTEYRGTANVTIEAGSVLNHGTTSFAGGSYTGGGVLKKGFATILSNTTWDVAIVDIDDGNTSIVNGASLVVNADSIDDLGNGINSTMIVEETGQLTLGLNNGGEVWFDNGGELLYEGGITQQTFLMAPAGGSALFFGAGAELEVQGKGASEAVIKLEAGLANITDIDGHLRLQGGGLHSNDANSIDGGVIAGQGELQIASGSSLHGWGLISTRIDGDGTAALVAINGSLMLTGGIEDIGLLGAEGSLTALHVTTPWNTKVAEKVCLDQGTIIGAAITNDNPGGISGRGTVTAQLINNSRVVSDIENGFLILSNQLNDWDGLTSTGILRADGGTLILQDNAEFLFHGTVEAVRGMVQTSGFGLQFQPGSMLQLENGVYRSDHSTDFGGAISVLADSPSVIRIDEASTFQSTSITALADGLRLEDGNSLIKNGAVFTGGGELHNTESHSLVLADGANIGVTLRNSGRLGLGSSVGAAIVLDYHQDASGLLQIDLGGANMVDYDRLNVNGIAQLDGVLELSVQSGFVPALNDAFTVLSAVAGVNGAFSEIDLSGAILGVGLGWEVIYGPSLVQLAVIELPSVLSGDYNNDGVVDAADYTVWRDNQGTAASLPNDLTPGAVTQSDYDVWKLNYGSVLSISASLPTTVPEPTAVILATACLAAFGCCSLR